MQIFDTTSSHPSSRNLPANRLGEGAVPIRFAVSLSPHPSSFAPLLFAGRLADGLTAAAQAGFSAVEISLRLAGELDVAWLDERLEQLGLVVSAFATGRMCLEDGLCLSTTNTVVHEQLFDRFTSLVQLAAHYRACVIIGGVRGRLSGDAPQKSAQYKAAIHTLQQIAELAGKVNVNLLIEPINRYETNFINNAREGAKLIEAIGHPCLKLLLDTFHMNIEEVIPCDVIREARPWLGYIHFADSNRQAPGRGHIDFPAIFEALAEVGYQGFISAEILPLPDDTQALSNTGQYLNSILLNLKRG